MGSSSHQRYICKSSCKCMHTILFPVLNNKVCLDFITVLVTAKQQSFLETLENLGGSFQMKKRSRFMFMKGDNCINASPASMLCSDQNSAMFAATAEQSIKLLFLEKRGITENSEFAAPLSMIRSYYNYWVSLTSMAGQSKLGNTAQCLTVVMLDQNKDPVKPLSYLHLWPIYGYGNNVRNRQAKVIQFQACPHSV